MAWIDEKWLRMALDAMRETFAGDPRMKNEMIQFLLDEGFWDKSLVWESAVAKFNACLNPNKAEFFKVGEVWALMKRFGQHHLFLAMAQDLGYEVRAIPTEARRQELLERIAVAYEKCDRTVGGAHAELVRLSTPPVDVARSTSVINGKAHFSLDPAGAPSLPAASELCI